MNENAYEVSFFWQDDQYLTVEDQEWFYVQENDYDDDTDDGYALASAGYGTDEDYGYGYDDF